MKRLILALAFAVVAVCGTTKTASAQEILLEGPLAGAPAVRKLVQYREMRFSAGPQFGYTILNDYMHNFLLGARLEFNVFDWLGIGAVAYYAFNAPTKLTQHISNSEDIGGSATQPAESNWPSYTGANNFEDQVALMKGMYLAQLSAIPLRGKLAVFEKLFVAVDGYLFLGGGVVHYEQRESCNGNDPSASNYCGDWNDSGAWEPSRESTVRGTFTAGIGFMVYFNDWFAVNLEYRLAPFKWNAGGTDEAGQAGTQWELGEGEDDEVQWQATSKGGDGDYPDGNIDDQDMTWNSNQSIGLGFIFHFPFEPTIAE
ncbi:MAG: outer membrane beta-barrel domain-containing protein [Polyangia bacterium]